MRQSYELQTAFERYLSGSGGTPQGKQKRLSVSRYAKVSPPFGRSFLGALAAHWQFAGGGARKLAPYL